MMESDKYYYILYVVDSTDNISFISNTDPIVYTIDIKSAKLYDDMNNVRNEILENYERFALMYQIGYIKEFIKAFIKVSPNGEYEILGRELIDDSYISG